jgi:hypothetical protein
MIQSPHSTISVAANSRWLVITRPLPPGSPLPPNAEQRMQALVTSELTIGVDIGRTRPRARRKRKPSIATLVKHAERTGKTVTSITTPDGTTINFDESTKSDSDALDQWIAKHADSPERH